jgi:hypothetical protein
MMTSPCWQNWSSSLSFHAGGLRLSRCPLDTQREVDRHDAWLACRRRPRATAAARLIPSRACADRSWDSADRVGHADLFDCRPSVTDQPPNNSEKITFYRYNEQVSMRHLDPGCRRLDGNGSPSVDGPISVIQAHSSVLGGSLPPIIPSQNNADTNVTEWRSS